MLPEKSGCVRQPRAGHWPDVSTIRQSIDTKGGLPEAEFWGAEGALDGLEIPVFQSFPCRRRQATWSSLQRDVTPRKLVGIESLTCPESTGPASSWAPSMMIGPPAVQSVDVGCGGLWPTTAEAMRPDTCRHWSLVLLFRLVPQTPVRKAPSSLLAGGGA